MFDNWRRRRAPDGPEPTDYQKVRQAILVSIDFANLEHLFPQIVRSLRDLSGPDRERLLGELADIAATDPRRREEAQYLLDGLRRVRWEQS
ncbi:hypothetical protein [Kitasatospora viridis]|uniref:Uncharacterized protein n=1 Tax=Kitasatospora viridis TaxID=281105 RepID=A0A561T721_9ACTN|nr:hypothetical protein [Kitasatospora viridis]TWF82899.1 hypothetical protein FHX73_14381 [Kitasatospora viridis]